MGSPFLFLALFPYQPEEYGVLAETSASTLGTTTACRTHKLGLLIILISFWDYFSVFRSDAVRPNPQLNASCCFAFCFMTDWHLTCHPLNLPLCLHKHLRALFTSPDDPSFLLFTHPYWCLLTPDHLWETHRSLIALSGQLWPHPLWAVPPAASTPQKIQPWAWHLACLNWKCFFNSMSVAMFSSIFAMFKQVGLHHILMAFLAILVIYMLML